VGTGIMADLMGLIKLPWGSTRISLQGWIFQKLFLSWASPIHASLAYAIAFVLLWLGLMWILYKRKIFIKV
jgi:predicted acyltransferase